jgi:hypothetical protein
MRRGILLAALLLVVAAPAGGAQSKPTLRLASVQPLRVTGTHFVARERVRITVQAGLVWHRKVRATRTGRVQATFPATHVDRCNGLIVVARGGHGDQAVLKLPPQPACAPE